MIRLIREHNSQKFIDDLKRVNDVMVYASFTREYFTITKKELRESACRATINYFITDRIFKVKRDVMVIK